MSLKAGSTADFGNSMAEAIQTAWDKVRGDTPTSDQVKLMFIAIAQGVIEHLQKNPDAFIINIHSSAGNDITYTGEVTKIT